MNHKPCNKVDSSNVSEKITNKSRIVDLLQQLSNYHVLLTVTLPRIGSTFTSAILAVDANDERFIMDELMPSEGQRHLREVGQLSVAGRLQGISANFSTNLIQIEEGDDISSNWMGLPEVVNYKQKRFYYRVPVGFDKKYQVVISTDGNKTYTGQLRDLSLGGIKAIFPADTDIKTGDIARYCRIKFVNHTTISCPLEIRFTCPSNSNKMLIIGGSFLDLTPQQERAIERIVRALERELLRKQA